MKMRSIIVNELSVTGPVKYKIYQDQAPATHCSTGSTSPALRPEFQRTLAIQNEASTSRVYFLEGE
jgi:hypothetical protein